MSRPAGGSRSAAGSGPRPQSSRRRVSADSSPKAESSRHAHPARRAAAGHIEPGKPERLQKILAHAGLGSRRGCERLILEGRVTVAGKVVRELGTRVDPGTERIAVDGEPVQIEPIVYFAVNKPKGYVSTNFDPAGRPRVIDLLPEIPERVYAVGRLDEQSTGLMILTNDGELANRLTHPRFGVEKTYRALVAGLPSAATLAQLTEGVWLSDGKVRAKRARLIGHQGRATQLELVLAEGKKREIRRMIAKMGHKVMSLNRVAIGPISLKGLSVGEARPLSRQEVELLRKVADGIALSAPRFSGAESSHRPRRDAHRTRSRATDEARSARNEATGAGPPPPPRRIGPHAKTTDKGTQPVRSRQQRPPIQGAPSLPGARPSRDRKAAAGNRQGGAIGPPGAPRRSRAVTSSLPPSQARPPRRIIGLEETSPQPPVGPGRKMAGRPGPRRPVGRRPRPPRIGLRGKSSRSPSSPTQGSEVDDT
jgi:23S rRNA pseudouridine2605 synthase